MNSITTIFWDIGGVLLNNAWDHEERQDAVSHFNIDEGEFESIHKGLVPAFETGQLSLDAYLDQSVFNQPRQFSKQDFRQYMLTRSRAKPDAISFARGLSESGKYLMSTLNNESRELNAYRIETFNLKKIFSLFLSSCYVAKRKPDEGIYRLALDVTQKTPDKCCFIDDRPGNLEAPARLGIHAIQMTNVDQLRKDLGALGVSA